MKYNHLLESDRDLKKPKILLGDQYGGHLDSAFKQSQMVAQAISKCILNNIQGILW